MKFHLEPGESMNVVAGGREYVITSVQAWIRGANQPALRVRSEDWVGGFNTYRPVLATSNEQGTSIVYEDMSADLFSARAGRTAKVRVCRTKSVARSRCSCKADDDNDCITCGERVWSHIGQDEEHNCAPGFKQ